MIAQKLHILHNKKKNDNNERNPAQNNVYKALGNKLLNRMIMNINKRHSKLKSWCNKTPNASYTHRCKINNRITHISPENSPINRNQLVTVIVA